MPAPLRGSPDRHSRRGGYLHAMTTPARSGADTRQQCGGGCQFRHGASGGNISQRSWCRHRQGRWRPLAFRSVVSPISWTFRRWCTISRRPAGRHPFSAIHPATSSYRGSGPQPHASTSRSRITVTPMPAWLRDSHLAADLLNRRAVVSLSQGKRNLLLRRSLRFLLAVQPNALRSES